MGGVVGVAALAAGVAAFGPVAPRRGATPTLPPYAVATIVPRSAGAAAVQNALAFSEPVAATFAADLDRSAFARPGAPRPGQATAYAVGPWVLALDDLDATRTARRVTVVVHCGAANRYSWQLDGTWPGSTRTHTVATGAGACDGDASAASVALASHEAPAQLATTVLVNRPYVLDVLVSR